jgi:hypothetical protein
VDAGAIVTRGVGELRRLLQERTFDLRTLDLADFRRWLDAQLDRWRNDPVFAQRARIRDLRRAHPHLQQLEAEYRRAVSADAATWQGQRLQQVEQEVIDTGKAVAGLSAALQRAGPERLAALRDKLTHFQARHEALRTEEAELIASSPARQHLLRLRAELQQARTAAGLDQEEAHLDVLLTQGGRRAGRSGESFERLALDWARHLILPDFASGSDAAGRRLVLTGVTLGAARTEFDQLIVRQSNEEGQAVEVLGVVEVKRNINDLAHGFRQRQHDLAWLTGDASRYDAALCRTSQFPSGHFDRPAVHQHDGQAFLLDRGSFRHFQRDPAADLFLDRLYFIMREGPLWGLSTAALGRVGYRLATDLRWQPDSEVYLGRLLDWCRSLAEPLETPDVLDLYASTPARAEQVLVAGFASPPGPSDE